MFPLGSCCCPYYPHTQLTGLDWLIVSLFLLKGVLLVSHLLWFKVVYLRDHFPRDFRTIAGGLHYCTPRRAPQCQFPCYWTDSRTGACLICFELAVFAFSRFTPPHISLYFGLRCCSCIGGCKKKVHHKIDFSLLLLYKG